MNDSRRYAETQGVRTRSEYMRRGYAGGMLPLPAVTTPTMAYVPFQTDIETYCESKALECGTLFPVLDKPFIGGRCR